LADAVGEVTTGLEELRDIAAGIFPPTLAENGLLVALETFALRYDGRVRISHSGGDARVASSLETAAYFCAVRLIEDCAATGATVAVHLQQGEEAPRTLAIRLRSACPPSPATVQLVQDRVEATHGELDRHTSQGETEHELVTSWDLGTA
jgi:hypothetical protein